MTDADFLLLGRRIAARSRRSRRLRLALLVAASVGAAVCAWGLR